MSNDGSDFLIACFSTAREELLIRVRKRDGWLRINLLSNAVLLALASGIKFVVEGQRPEFACLAPFASLVFACMYTVEDRLIGHLGSYIGSLSEAEAVLRGRPQKMIVNWDISSQLRDDYAKGPALKVRLLAQVLAFTVIPGVVGWSGVRSIHHSRVLLIVAMALAIAVAGLICAGGFRFRHKTGEIAKANAVSAIVALPNEHEHKK